MDPTRDVLFETVRVSFEQPCWCAQDYRAVAKKDSLKPIEVELKRIEDIVSGMTESLKHVKTREEEMRNTNESTNARVLWFSVLALVILVGLGVGQLVYLRRFFESKKML